MAFILLPMIGVIVIVIFHQTKKYGAAIAVKCFLVDGAQVQMQDHFGVVLNVAKQ
jgi:hypothetical protein